MNDIIESSEQLTTGNLITAQTDWDHPTPFLPVQNQDTPYPLHALPQILQKTVAEYQQYGQQPVALVACSALANVSLACQSLANVARDHYLKSPVSLYFVIVASSGERKTGCDSIFSRAIRRWEDNIRRERIPMIQAALSLHRAWQMQRDELILQLKSTSFSDNNTHNTAELEELMFHEPEIPLQPALYFEDVTQEALAHHLAKGWPSSSLWSDEAGIVIGSHSMKSNPTRFVALLNRLWDAKPFTAHRKTSATFTLKDRRLTLNLMMQPILMQQLLLQPNSIARQSGFLARCLVAYPTSMMGQRFYKEPTDRLTCFNDYNQRITDCLSQTEELTVHGCIGLPTLVMSPSAKKHWAQFFNSIESGLSENGQWSTLKDFASKAAENTARLAALFHLFEGKEGEISAEHVEQAVEIIGWHMQETRRLLTTESSAEPVHDAQKLISWLVKKQTYITNTRDLQRLSPLRDKTRVNEAVAVLIEHQMMRSMQDGNQIFLEVNPDCF